MTLNDVIQGYWSDELKPNLFTGLFSVQKGVDQLLFRPHY